MAALFAGLVSLIGARLLLVLRADPTASLVEGAQAGSIRRHLGHRHQAGELREKDALGRGAARVIEPMLAKLAAAPDRRATRIVPLMLERLAVAPG